MTTKAAPDESQIHIDPFVPASARLPEITPRAVILGIILAIILAGSTTYVGLKIARTISASIPAALISMLVLRRFKGANILENNMVQTIASAGEVVAAGIIFTLPALIVLGYWQSFNYFQTALIAAIGGILGVLFSVPLRRSMIVKENLPYPEGLAVGEVLKAGENTHKGSTKLLLVSSLLSAGLSFLQLGFKIAAEQAAYWTKIGTTAFGVSFMFSPVLTAAGYIVGMRGLIAFMVGGALTWGVAIPIFVSLHGLPAGAGDLGAALASIQKAQFRYVGVGVMAVGGLWCVISLAKQISQAFKASFAAMKAHRSEFASTARTDRDLPFKYVLMGVAGIAIPTFFLFLSFIDKANIINDNGLLWATVIFATVFSLIVAFIGSAIASYIVGSVGTTSVPISGITIAAIIAFATVLLLLLSHHINFSVNSAAAIQAAAIVIIFAAVVCVAASLGGDNLQDLKAGQIVGATPWKQQLMLAVGAMASALVIPFILQTTFEAYGIGDVLPRAGMNPENALPAPQATLMATVAKGFFSGKLPWNMIIGGALLGVICILVDEYLRIKKTGYRFHPLLFALGVYFPYGYVTAFFIGGLIRSFAIWSRKSHGEIHDNDPGILCASGIIAGDAILGALLTIPFAYYQTTDVFALKLAWLTHYETVIGVALFIGLFYFLYLQGKRRR